MQEMFANNAQVEMIKAEDADYHYNTLTAISTTGAVQKEWQTPKAKRVKEVLPSSLDPITSSQRELPISPTLDWKTSNNNTCRTGTCYISPTNASLMSLDTRLYSELTHLPGLRTRHKSTTNNR